MPSPLIVIGLGNPGPEYEETRHNAGFRALDFLAQSFHAPNFQLDPKFFAELSSALVDGQKVIFAKPTMYMNESGRTVRALLDFYKLTPADVIVIHDDLDIAPGTLRTTESSRAAGHNGVTSIIEHLGTQDFFRIRLGIGRPAETTDTCIPAHDYVLGRFSEEESSALETLWPEIETLIQDRLSSSHAS